MTYNPTINCNALQVGQVVCLSPIIVTTKPTTTTPAVPLCTRVHVVQPG